MVAVMWDGPFPEQERLSPKGRADSGSAWKRGSGARIYLQPRPAALRNLTRQERRTWPWGLQIKTTLEQPIGTRTGKVLTAGFKASGWPWKEEGRAEGCHGSATRCLANKRMVKRKESVQAGRRVRPLQLWARQEVDPPLGGDMVASRSRHWMCMDTPYTTAGYTEGREGLASARMHWMQHVLSQKEAGAAGRTSSGQEDSLGLQVFLPDSA